MYYSYILQKAECTSTSVHPYLVNIDSLIKYNSKGLELKERLGPEKYSNRFECPLTTGASVILSNLDPLSQSKINFIQAFSGINPRINFPKRVFSFFSCSTVPVRITAAVLSSLSLLYSTCLLYTSPSPRDRQKSRMPSSA